MIALFNTQVEAVAYSNKIHAYLQSVRPGYNAVKWADPVEGSDGTWSVKTPVEWEDNRWGTPFWIQPTGAQDAYNIGAKVHFPTINDPVYESLIDYNTYSPTAYPAGWKKL